MTGQENNTHYASRLSVWPKNWPKKGAIASRYNYSCSRPIGPLLTLAYTVVGFVINYNSLQ